MNTSANLKALHSVQKKKIKKHFHGRLVLSTIVIVRSSKYTVMSMCGKCGIGISMCKLLE